MNKITTAIAIAGMAAGTAAASDTVVAEFLLCDHPDGALSHRDYGLRWDNLSFEYSDGFQGTTDEGTFSVEYINDVYLRVIDHGGGNLDIEISGTVYGGPADGSNQTVAYVTNTYTDVAAVADGWVAYDMGVVGTLDFLDDSFQDEEMFAKQNGEGISFYLLSNGHRLDGDDSSWVGRGWFGGADRGFTRDWLVTAKLVPAPGAAVTALAGLGLIARRRR